MVKGKEHLSRVLNTHLNNIHDTFQVLEQTPVSSLEKVSWDQVITMGDQISKQATIAGMLWTGQAPVLNELEENMKVYFNMLQGFLLLSHGSMMDAGPTLCSSIHAAVKHVIDCSFSLMKEAVSSYGSLNSDGKLSIPQLAGLVWEACDSLKKTPTTNHIAIGRAITQVAVSIKDVLRELKELKPDFVDQANTPDEPHNDDEDDVSSEGDIGNDLLAEEMIVAQSATNVVSDTLVVVKELIRFTTGLRKQSNPNNSNHCVKPLERLLKVCQRIGVQVDELGACLYPPQEIPALKVSIEKISSGISEMQTEVRGLEGSPTDGFFKACECLGNSIRGLESELLQYDATNPIPEIQNLTLQI